MHLGRKFLLTLICAVLITVGFVSTGFFPIMGEAFGQFTIGLSGLLGIYCGGNVTNKLVTRPPNSNQGV